MACLGIFLLWYCSATIGAQYVRHAIFARVKGPAGQNLCATSDPYDIVPNNSEAISCMRSMSCADGEYCGAFNFNEQKGKCEKFFIVPNNYSIVPGCVGYAAQSMLISLLLYIMLFV